MKNLSITLLILVSLISFAACGQQPLTEAQQAANYNLSLSEYKEIKQAAARMNMSIEEHMKTMEAGSGMDHGNMMHGEAMDHDDQMKMMGNDAQ